MVIAIRPLGLVLLVVCGFVGLAACGRNRDDAYREPPAGASDPGPMIARAPGGTSQVPPQPITPKDALEAADFDMRDVLVELEALGAKSIATLTVAEARKQTSPADAVVSLLRKKFNHAAPLEMARVDNRRAGTNAVRIYTPKADATPLPVIVYFHGGGWVIADIDTYDASARALAQGAQAIVVSAEYRRAPEHKFPAAHDDAIAAYEWVTKNAASLGGDPRRIALAGESAGGNLALNVAIAAREKGLTTPVHQLLIYPVTQTDMQTRSYVEWANAKPLDRAGMVWFAEKALRTPADRADPRISLIDANLRGLSPTTLVLAEIDPLRSDGELLAEHLGVAGVDVEQKLYTGVTHEFFGMGAYVADAKAAQEYATNRLRRAFTTPPGEPESPRP